MQAQVKKPCVCVGRSRNPLALGMWHEVRLERVGRKGTMWLDDAHAVSGESPVSRTN